MQIFYDCGISINMYDVWCVFLRYKWSPIGISVLIEAPPGRWWRRTCVGPLRGCWVSSMGALRRTSWSVGTTPGTSSPPLQGESRDQSRFMDGRAALYQVPLYLYCDLDIWHTNNSTCVKIVVSLYPFNSLFWFITNWSICWHDLKLLLNVKQLQHLMMNGILLS